MRNYLISIALIAGGATLIYQVGGWKLLVGVGLLMFASHINKKK